MKSVKVLYISDINPDTLVFHSQVLGMVRAWNQVARTALLYHSRKRCSFSSEDFAVFESKGWPSLNRLLWRLETLTNNWRKLLADYEIIHCRDAVTAWMALQAIPRKERRNYKIIYDCRGAFVEELHYQPHNLPTALLNCIRGYEYRAMERWVMARADLVLAVSKHLSDYLMEKYGRKADLVIHAIIAAEKFRFSAEQKQTIRDQLGWNNRKVFIYAGSSARWQRLDLLGRWWSHYHPQNPGAHLLALTDEPAEFLKAAGLTGSADLDNITIRTIPHEEVPCYLSAADCGIIFRDDSLVNRVASPVKLSEYLASGLSIITNQKYYQEVDPNGIFLIDPYGNDTLSLTSYNDYERSMRSAYWIEQLSGNNAVKKISGYLFPADSGARN